MNCCSKAQQWVFKQQYAGNSNSTAPFQPCSWLQARLPFLCTFQALVTHSSDTRHSISIFNRLLPKLLRLGKKKYELNIKDIEKKKKPLMNF